MKKVLVVCICLALISCNSLSVAELEKVKLENATLRNTVDSLRNALSALTYVEPRRSNIKKKKSSKKGSTSNSTTSVQNIPYSAFSATSSDDAKPAVTERSSHQVTTPEPVRSYPTRSKSVSYSGRCQATTKKGSQCKRTANSGSYCWQHGG